MEKTIQTIIYAICFFYATLELVTPLLILHICNKVNKIERKLTK